MLAMGLSLMQLFETTRFVHKTWRLSGLEKRNKKVTIHLTLSGSSHIVL
jgi:hypothetical protein